jgi:hypothetical protein
VIRIDDVSRARPNCKKGGQVVATKFFFVCWVMIVLGIVFYVSANAMDAVEGDHGFISEEFGFSVKLPRRFPVCLAETDRHLHGVGSVLIGNDCENKNNYPAFQTWSDYNDSFDVDALAVIRRISPCLGASPHWATGQWRDSIDGLKTAMCTSSETDHVAIILIAMSGTQIDENSPGDNFQVPRYVHKVGLYTSQARLKKDLLVFKHFVSSIRITEAKPLGVEIPDSPAK